MGKITTGFTLSIDEVGGGVRYPQFIDPDGNMFTLQEMSWRTGDAF